MIINLYVATLNGKVTSNPFILRPGNLHSLIYITFAF